MTTMNRDGISTCPPGQEQYEEYYEPVLKRYQYQYDYRTPQGRLFTTVAKTLETARARRDTWLDELAKTDPARLYSKPVNRKYKEPIK